MTKLLDDRLHAGLFAHRWGSSRPKIGRTSGPTWSAISIYLCFLLLVWSRRNARKWEICSAGNCKKCVAIFTHAEVIDVPLTFQRIRRSLFNCVMWNECMRYLSFLQYRFMYVCLVMFSAAI